MIFETVISTVVTLVTLVAAGYAAHRIENVLLARRGYDTRNFFKPVPPPTPKPPPAVKLWTEADDRRQALAFIEHPSAFWLDPNLFGDNPNWRDKLAPRDEYGDTPMPVIYGRTHAVGSTMDYMLTDEEWDRQYRLAPSPAPPCPTCHTGRRMVLTDHGGEATSWACVDCDTEFTRAGETKTSRKRRKRLAKRDDYDSDLPLPPSME